MLVAVTTQTVPFPPCSLPVEPESTGIHPPEERGPVGEITSAESRLLQRILDGESQLFEDLMRPYRSRLRRVAMTSTRNAADADDIAQRTEIRAFLHLRSFRAECRFSTWLYQIARNEIAHYWRLRVRERDRVSPAPIEGEMSLESRWPDPCAGPLDIIEKEELVRSVRSHIQRLPHRLRGVIELCDLHGLSLAQAADRLSLSLAATKTRLFRARKRLAQSQTLRDLSVRRTAGAIRPLIRAA